LKKNWDTNEKIFIVREKYNPPLSAKREDMM
jgi:hypothetical protein